MKIIYFLVFILSASTAIASVRESLSWEDTQVTFFSTVWSANIEKSEDLDNSKIYWDSESREKLIKQFPTYLKGLYNPSNNIQERTACFHALVKLKFLSLNIEGDDINSSSDTLLEKSIRLNIKKIHLFTNHNRTINNSFYNVCCLVAIFAHCQDIIQDIYELRGQSSLDRVENEFYFLQRLKPYLRHFVTESLRDLDRPPTSEFFNTLIKPFIFFAYREFNNDLEEIQSSYFSEKKPVKIVVKRKLLNQDKISKMKAAESNAERKATIEKDSIKAYMAVLKTRAKAQVREREKVEAIEREENQKKFKLRNTKILRLKKQDQLVKKNLLSRKKQRKRAKIIESERIKNILMPESIPEVSSNIIAEVEVINSGKITKLEQEKIEKNINPKLTCREINDLAELTQEKVKLEEELRNIQSTIEIINIRKKDLTHQLLEDIDNHTTAQKFANKAKELAHQYKLNLFKTRIDFEDIIAQQKEAEDAIRILEMKKIKRYCQVNSMRWSLLSRQEFNQLET